MVNGNEPAWKPIPDWPNYEVSTEGQVRALVGSGFARGRLRFPRFKKAHVGRDGYARVTLHEKRGTGRRTETWTIHRLVACCFVEGDRALDAAHLDGNKLNNRADNLRWCSRRENESHKAIHGTKADGSRNGQSKLDERCVAAIRALHFHEKISQSVLAERFNVCQGTISAVLLNKTWDHVQSAS